MNEHTNALEERHYTIRELSRMWRFSDEFVRQIVKDEPGVTEWVRQRPGRRRYRVLRVPQSVAERLYRRALVRAEIEAPRLAGDHNVLKRDRLPWLRPRTKPKGAEQ
ncbi:MAG: hypothetical protein ACRENC_13435 [Gemmatimonadaceae bacterium]